MTNFYFSSFLAAAALAASMNLSATTLTVADGTDTSNELPVFAYWMDRGQHFQVIYPEAELAEMKGKSVTQMTFYLSSLNKDLACPEVTLSLGVAASEGFAVAEYSAEPTLAVSTAPMTVAVSDDPKVWTVTFKNPYRYNGGNLLVDIKSDKCSGSAPRAEFYGVKKDYNTGITSRSSAVMSKFLPKCTFEFEDTPSESAMVSVESVKFPLTFSGSQAEAVFSVINMGTEPVAGTLTVAPDNDFSVYPETIASLESGASQEVVVTFAPFGTGETEATVSVDLGVAGVFEVALSGSGIDAPAAYRELFDSSDYASVVPQGWTAYAEEFNVNGGALTDYTSEYANFPSTLRFSSYSFDGSRGIAWNHVNWVANTDVYRQFYYLISPEASGRVVIRGKLTDLPATGAFIEAYPAVQAADGTFIFEAPAYDIVWDNELTDTSWSIGSFTADRGARVAFFIKFGALDFFASDNTVGIGSVADTTSLSCRQSGPGFVSYTTKESGIEYSVYDLAGCLVKRTRVNGSSGIVELPVRPGLYIVRITDGVDTVALKVVK